jgi:hypothetical protein
MAPYRKFKYLFFKNLLVTLMTLLPSLMGLWEEQAITSLSFKGLEFSDESPTFKWEWFSEPLDCPPYVNPNQWWER